MSRRGVHGADVESGITGGYGWFVVMLAAIWSRCQAVADLAGGVQDRLVFPRVGVSGGVQAGLVVLKPNFRDLEQVNPE